MRGVLTIVRQTVVPEIREQDVVIPPMEIVMVVLIRLHAFVLQRQECKVLIAQTVEISALKARMEVAERHGRVGATITRVCAKEDGPKRPMPRLWNNAIH